MLPRTWSKNEAVSVVVDKLTKLAHLIAIQILDVADAIVVKYIDEIIRLHGVLTSIVLDRDSRFTSHI